MLLDHDRAEVVFKKLKHVREDYLNYILQADRNRLSVESLLTVVGRMYDVSIERYIVPFKAQHTRGMLLRYENKAEIYVREQLDEHMRRFTAVKETCHVFLDEPEDWSPEGVRTIEEFQDDRFLNGQDRLATRTSQSEVFAEIAAIELMYPYECRLSDLKTGQLNFTKISSEHGMPVAMVERALASNHQAIAEKMWQIVEPIRFVVN